MAKYKRAGRAPKSKSKSKSKKVPVQTLSVFERSTGKGKERRLGAGYSQPQVLWSRLQEDCRETRSSKVVEATTATWLFLLSESI